MEYLNLFTLMSTFCAVYMTGVIWMVQLAHYPLMVHIEPQSFKAYQKANLPSTTWVVIPVMTLEVVVGAAQLFTLIWSESTTPHHTGLHALGLGALLIIWLSTFFLQVPLHQKLLSQKDELIIQKLVRTNWIRTLTWSLRSVLLIYLTTAFTLD